MMPVKQDFENEMDFYEALRDWFAGQALAGFSSAHNQDGIWTARTEQSAVVAYELAGAMLLEKLKK